MLDAGVVRPNTEMAVNDFIFRGRPSGWKIGPTWHRHRHTRPRDQKNAS